MLFDTEETKTHFNDLPFDVQCVLNLFDNLAAYAHFNGDIGFFDVYGKAANVHARSTYYIDCPVSSKKQDALDAVTEWVRNGCEGL